MRCSDCQNYVPESAGVHLSAYRFVCLVCFDEMQAAWRQENAGMPYQSQCYVPSPEELAQRISAVRRGHCGQPHNVEPSKVPHLPKRSTTSLTGRRGTEERAV